MTKIDVLFYIELYQILFILAPVWNSKEKIKK